MIKAKIITFDSATKCQLKKQYELRVSTFRSQPLRDVAEYLFTKAKRKVTFSELRDSMSDENCQICSLIKQLKKTHGFDIVNSAKLGQEGVYQLVGFTLRNRDHEKKVIEAEHKKLKLLNSVFC
ncbi:conserved hypothetical protein [Vibrio phage 242E40-1]|nr:conserved hypothetical protein [Vibrio phage 242E40-1]